MKILYLSACSQLGGAERALLDMLASIRAANSEVSLHVVATEDGPLVSECRALDVEATVVGLPKRVARLGDAASEQNLLTLCAAAPSIIAYLLRLRRVIHSFAPDVVHTNGFKVHLLGAFAKPRAAALVWHIHDFVSSRPVMAKLLRRLSGFCDVAVANSRAVAADVRAVCEGRLEVKTIHNAVDLQRFSSTGAAVDVDELAGMRPSVPDTIRVGLVATLARWKGHETFLRAMSLLPRDLAVRGYIIGDAIYQTDGSQYSLGELRALADKLGVADRVGFTGFIDDTASAMRALDIVVHASTEREPFGLVIAEAAACGKSIIASQNAGATELMQEGADFLSHRGGDPVSLTGRIIHLTRDGELRQRLGATARGTAELHFDRMSLSAALIPLYRSVEAQMSSARKKSHGAVESHAVAMDNGWTFKPWHFWLLLIGFALRVALAFSMDREAAFGGWDGKEYFAYAQSLLNLNWDDYPRYFNFVRPPFYPIFLMPFVALSDSVWPIQMVQALLGVVNAVTLAKLAGRWRGQRSGNWAFALALFHPFLIYYPAYILTETLFITLLWLGLAYLQRLSEPKPKNFKRWLSMSAIALGLACLTRPALQPFLIVAVLWIGWRTLQWSRWRNALAGMARFTVITSAFLLPFMIANFMRHGDASLAPHGAQLNYALSNSPEYLRMYEAETKDEYHRLFGQRIASFSVESGTSRERWMEEAQAFRQNQSADWWRLQGHKLKHFWTPWLNPLIFSRELFLLSLFSVTPLFFFAATEISRRRRSLDSFMVLLLGLMCVGYLVGGFLFHVQVRYRFPFVDMSCMLLTASFLGTVRLGHFQLKSLTAGVLQRAYGHARSVSS